jgi:hypothetical protein
MKTNSAEITDARWQKTPVANLVRHVQSGNYYARIRVRGKLIWKSLKTDRISVAKLRLSDFHKEERATRSSAFDQPRFFDPARQWKEHELRDGQVVYPKSWRDWRASGAIDFHFTPWAGS